MKCVLDACAVIALVRAEKGADVVAGMLEDAKTTCLIHAANICEVYYDAVRVYGEKKADSLLVGLEAAGLVVRDDMDPEFWKAAGRLKARGRISLADAFAVTLAEREQALLLTSDRHEFEPLLAKGDFPVDVRFLR